MKRLSLIVAAALLISPVSGFAQRAQEKVDTTALARIKEEGLQHSQVMQLLSALCDVYGPRLSWSPEYARGAEWVRTQLKGWGLQDVHYDYWAPVGKGWTLRNFSAMVTAPVPYPVIAYPSAWSPGFKEREADVVHLDAKKPEELEKYRGTLKGKYVLINDLADVGAHWEPQAVRLADSVLLRMANADPQGVRRGRRSPYARITAENIDSALHAMRLVNPDVDSAAFVDRILGMRMVSRRLQFAQSEHALAAINWGRGDGGTMIVQGASVPQAQDSAAAQRVNPYDPKAPEIIPQIVFASEHYNRLVRMLKAGEKVRLEMRLEVATTKADSGFNIIGEIPGTDLKDEVVMLGAHFDTWHSGTGATDNNTGTAACMEAVRILRTISEKYGMKPRRTIRIAFWGAEEQGLIGSREYVAEAFTRREGGQQSSTARAGVNPDPLPKIPAYDRFSVYFNHDNGTGRIRGVYMQGNEAARPIFRAWLSAFGDPTAQTLSLQSTRGTDHLSFDAAGLPGFQFIQDPVEYPERTHHYNMDVYERVLEPDMKQAATMLAFFVYNAATRSALFPRKAVAGSAVSQR